MCCLLLEALVGTKNKIAVNMNSIYNPTVHFTKPSNPFKLAAKKIVLISHTFSVGPCNLRPDKTFQQQK